MSGGPSHSLLALALIGAGTLAFASAAQASFYGQKHGPAPALAASNPQGPVAGADIDVIEHIGQRVPRGLAFTDGHGDRVIVDDLLRQGKPLVVTLGYYRCPMLCNLVHEGLVKAIKKNGLVLGRDFLGLAVSVDPDEDPKTANTNQGRLLRALEQGKPEDWRFVLDRSPGAAAAAALADSVGFRYKYDPQSKQFAHSAVAFVLTPDGVISRYLYGVDYPPRDLRFAVVEASGGRVGTSLDRVLLACFKYDPFVQRYTPYAIAFVRIGAGLTFLSLVTLLAYLWRKELLMRRRRAA